MQKQTKLSFNNHQIRILYVLLVIELQTKRPNLKVFCQKHANGIANSEDPDQTAPLGAV